MTDVGIAQLWRMSEFQTGTYTCPGHPSEMRFSSAGRAKELINRGGIKFNPVEVEEVLTGLSALQQSAIIPIPDPVLGERACLCVA